MNTLPQPRYSPHGYGILSMEDAPFMEHCLHLVMREHGRIRFLELGVANGGTTVGVYNHCQKMRWPFQWVGMDMAIGAPSFDLGDWGRFIVGDFHDADNVERAKQAMPNGYNLLFVDGAHCFCCCTKDFELYSPMVVKNGYVIFHDTCSHKDWQNNPAFPQCKPDTFIETRRALRELNLDPCTREDYAFVGQQDNGTGQGMYCVQKV